ncbi:MAG: ABC transporter ATP-binding protein [Thermodesulfovibrionales bacterium]
MAVWEGFRWALLGADTSPGPMLIGSSLAALLLLVSGLCRTGSRDLRGRGVAWTAPLPSGWRGSRGIPHRETARPTDPAGDADRLVQIPSLRRPTCWPAGPRGGGRAERKVLSAPDVSFDIKGRGGGDHPGRNGAGKSTLLKVLSRIVEPTKGSAEIHGRVGSLLEVGTGFHPQLTGRENIYLNGAILGMRRTEIERKFDEIVSFAEVEKFIDTPVKHYSSGMYLRLAFAVAAHLEPEILIVDEVLAVGDTNFQKKCLNKMHDVGQHGRTVSLLVSARARPPCTI